MSSSSSYEPLGEEPLVEGAVPRRKGKRVARTKKRAGGKGRAVGLLLLILVIVAVVVLAITLPIVLTRNNNAAAAAGSRALADGSTVPGSSPSSPSGANSSPSGVNSSPSSNSGASTGVGPNTNMGDVYCYKDASGNVLPGAFKKSGATRTSDGVERSEVTSCGTQSALYLRTDRLSLCSAECREPMWLAVERGDIIKPIWEQDYVAQGDQTYENTRQTRWTWYWRYAAYVRELLVMECATNSAYWVADRELRFASDTEQSVCRTTALGRTSNLPVEVPGGIRATVGKVRTVCTRSFLGKIEPFRATGVEKTGFVWGRLWTVPQSEVQSCTGAPDKWFLVKSDLVVCDDAALSTCAAAPAGTTTTSTSTTTATKPAQ